MVAPINFEDAAPVPGLSPRESQTLGRLLKGFSEKQIALALSISRHTVHIYVKQLYRRFRVNSRSELLALWIGGSNQFPVSPLSPDNCNMSESLADLLSARLRLAIELAALDQRLAAIDEDLRRCSRLHSARDSS